MDLLQSRCLALGLLLLSASPLVRAQAESLAITGARLFDGAEWRGETTVLIAGERIVSMFPGKTAPGRAVEVGDATVLPGLIDAHTHLLVAGNSQAGNDAELAAYLEEVLPELLRAYLSAGVTTIMSTGDFWPAILDVRAAVAAGEMAGPRIVATGPMISARDGHPGETICRRRGRTDFWCRRRLAPELDTTGAVAGVVEKLASSGVDGIKLVYDDLGLRRIRRLSPDVGRLVVEEARRHGLPVYAHVYEPEAAIDTISWGISGLVHVPGSADPERNRRALEAIRSSGTTAASTLTLLDFALSQADAPISRRRLSGASSISRPLADAGLLAFGTDAPRLDPATAVQREIELLAAAGLDPTQILTAATRVAARHIGRGDMLGSLAAGRVADLLVVEGDPRADLDSLKRVVLVIKAGRIVVDNR